MRALDKKLVRDIQRLWAQSLSRFLPTQITVTATSAGDRVQVLLTLDTPE